MDKYARVSRRDHGDPRRLHAAGRAAVDRRGLPRRHRRAARSHGDGPTDRARRSRRASRRAVGLTASVGVAVEQVRRQGRLRPAEARRARGRGGRARRRRSSRRCRSRGSGAWAGSPAAGARGHGRPHHRPARGGAGGAPGGRASGERARPPRAGPRPRRPRPSSPFAPPKSMGAEETFGRDTATSSACAPRCAGRRSGWRASCAAEGYAGRDGDAQAPLRGLLHDHPAPHRRPDPGRARDLPRGPRSARSHPAPPGGAAHRAVRVRARARRGQGSSRCSARTPTRRERLARAMDRVTARFGEESLRPASLLSNAPPAAPVGRDRRASRCLRRWASARLR